MSEERFIDIETRLAHQDQALHELDEVVTKQQEIIMKLERLCDSMRERLQAMNDAAPPDQPQDERPPHY